MKEPHISHFLFMDNLKLFENPEPRLERLLETTDVKQVYRHELLGAHFEMEEKGKL